VTTRTHRIAALLFAAAVAPSAACMSTDPDPGDPGDPDHPDGETGKVTVRYPWGTVEEDYVVIGGLVVINGDLELGPASLLGDRANITMNTDKRWTSNQVRFAFLDDVTDTAKTRIRNAAQSIEDISPLDFIEIANPCADGTGAACATDYVLFRRWDESYGLSNSIGMAGGQQRITAPDGFSTGGYRHELMHAIGSSHEQKRADAAEYVTINEECLEVDDMGNPTMLSQFTPGADPSTSFGTYDFTSIMQYRSSSFRRDDYLLAPCNGNQPLERIDGSCPAATCVDADGNGSREFINSTSALSAGDIDSLWAMYGTPLNVSDANDRFGAVVAHGDFDGDGREDLAVGAPGEDTVSNTVNSAGAVMVYKGTEDGFQPWDVLHQGAFGALEEAGDDLGAALAVGDFDDDGIDDLAVGAPGESVGGGTDVDEGAVYLFTGGATGLTYAHAVTQDDLGALVEADDRFGEALAKGDYDGDGIDDLAIGSPGETHGDGIHAGHVYVMRGTGNTNAMLTTWSDVGQETLSTAPNASGGIIPPPTPLGTDAAGERFGASIASGRFDEDTRDDLVVGAYCDAHVANCAGGAYLYRGGTLAQGMRGWMRVNQGSIDNASDHFGRAVAGGDADMDGDDDILIGAPQHDTSGASNSGIVLWVETEGHVVIGTAQITQPNSDAGVNDNYGYSIDIGINGAFDVIAIGAPNEQWGAGLAAGAVFVLNASDTAGEPVFQEILRASPASDELTEDSFGTAVAVFTDGGADYLIVGNPGENTSSGMVQVFEASPSGTDFDQGQVVTQDLSGTRVD
jgi:hypothetical protein